VRSPDPMALIRNEQIVDDPFVVVQAGDAVPSDRPVIVDLETWQSLREQSAPRSAPIGVRLRSDQSPDLIADDLDRLSVVALEFPAFRDGRAYSYARILRERYGYDGVIRAVGEVLLEQLHFMLRTGFDAFELDSTDPLGDYREAVGDFSVWYQPTGDGRATAVQRRHASQRARP
jgi:uncharacterized protein (DUF934 family)